MGATTDATLPLNSAPSAKIFLNLCTINGAVGTTNLPPITLASIFLHPQLPVSCLLPFHNVCADEKLRLGEISGLPDREKIDTDKWRNRVSKISTHDYSCRSVN